MPASRLDQEIDALVLSIRRTAPGEKLAALLPTDRPVGLKKLAAALRAHRPGEPSMEDVYSVKKALHG
jgi:hypothetical protein